MRRKAASKRRKREKPLFVVFGLAEDGKAKGACFRSKQIELALEAATTIPGMTVYEAVSTEMQQLARQLPTGSEFANRGRSLPYIPRQLYEQFYAASGGLVRDRAHDGDDQT